MVIGKLDNYCETPQPNFIAGDESVNQPEEIFICNNGNQVSSFDFPDKGMINPNGGASAETSLGKRKFSL